LDSRATSLFAPVPERLFTSGGAAGVTLPATIAGRSRGSSAGVLVSDGTVRASQWGFVVAAWALVGVPLAWGVFKTLTLAAQMF
jgi:L-asparaginase II